MRELTPAPVGSISPAILYSVLEYTRCYRLIEDIIRLINDNGLQKYTFTPEWEGCRFWIYTLISYLEEQGIIQPGSADTAWNAVSYYYINPEGYEVRDVRQGTFRSSE